MKSMKRDLFCVFAFSTRGVAMCVSGTHTPTHTAPRPFTNPVVVPHPPNKSLSKSWREKPRVLEAPQGHQLANAVNQDTL